MAGGEPILSLRDLRVTFPTPAGPARAVRGVDLDVFAGESVAVVGESGSGKSVTMLATLGLLPQAEVSGSVKWGNTELVGANVDTLRSVRGSGAAKYASQPGSTMRSMSTSTCGVSHPYTSTSRSCGASASTEKSSGLWPCTTS